MSEEQQNIYKRPDWDDYFINIARAVSERATCLRRRYGSVVTKGNSIVSTGYNGAPRGMLDCLEAGKCTRKEQNVPHGQRYELCHSVHSEANAILRASAADLDGSTIYIAGIDCDEGPCLSEPCMMCKRIILNAKVARVVYSDGNGGLISEEPAVWLRGRV